MPRPSRAATSNFLAFFFTCFVQNHLLTIRPVRSRYCLNQDRTPSGLFATEGVHTARDLDCPVTTLKWCNYKRTYAKPPVLMG